MHGPGSVRMCEVPEPEKDTRSSYALHYPYIALTTFPNACTANRSEIFGFIPP